MSAVTTDEVVNVLVELARDMVERSYAVGASTRPSINGDQAIGLIANSLLEIANRLQRGEFGP